MAPTRVRGGGGGSAAAGMALAAVLAAALLSVAVAAPPPTTAIYDALAGSFRFFEAQISGVQPEWSRARFGQPEGFRGDSHLQDASAPLDDKEHPTVDAVGGLYDAGDHMKSGIVMGTSASLLAYSALKYEKSLRKAGLWDNVVRIVDHVAAYFVKAHYAPDRFVAQVGDLDRERSTWMRPEQDNEPRNAYHIRTGDKAADILAEAAATMFGAALLVRRAGALQSADQAAEYAGKARELYDMAAASPGVWTVNKGTMGFLTSTFEDDMAWAAAWGCRFAVDMDSPAERAQRCGEAKTRWDALANRANTLSFSSVHALAALMLRDLNAVGATPNEIRAYRNKFEGVLQSHFNTWLDTSRKCSTNDGSYPTPLCYTEAGFAHRQDSHATGFAMDMAFVALASVASHIGDPKYQRTAVRHSWSNYQAAYILGAVAPFKSYVVGYGAPGSTDPKRPLHRASSCNPNPAAPCGKTDADSPNENPSTLYGALVSGPTQLDTYADIRTNTLRNGVNTRTNAGLTAALTALVALETALIENGCSLDNYIAGNCGLRKEIPMVDDTCPTADGPFTEPCNLDDAACVQCENKHAGNDAAIAVCRSCVQSAKDTNSDPFRCSSLCSVSSASCEAEVCMTDCLPQLGSGGDWACDACIAGGVAGGGFKRSFVHECYECAKNMYNALDCVECMAPAKVETRGNCTDCLARYRDDTRPLTGKECAACAARPTEEGRLACEECVKAGEFSLSACARGAVQITAPGEAYSSHGWCKGDDDPDAYNDGWNRCSGPDECALMACRAKGYKTLLSYGDVKYCQEFAKCNLWWADAYYADPYARTCPKHLYGYEGAAYGWCMGLKAVTDIVCTNEGYEKVCAAGVSLTKPKTVEFKCQPGHSCRDSSDAH